MENKKNTLRLEYLPLTAALELYKQGIFVMGVFPSSSLEEDLANVDKSLKDEFLTYYNPNLQTGLFVYDMSIEDYEPELDNVVINGDSVHIKEVFSDELGYGIETENGDVVNYNTRNVYDNASYEKEKSKLLANSKQIAKTAGAMLATPFTRYVTMKAKKVPNYNEMLQDGLYHFTSEKAADAIMESGYIKPSGRITSYSIKKKTFFFGANPELQDVLYNCNDLQKHMTAIHVKYNDALKREIEKGKIEVRLDDGAVCMVGATKSEHGYELEKVQMELVKDEATNRFYYKEVKNKELTDSEIKSSVEVDEKLNSYLKIPKGLRGIVTFPEVATKAVDRFMSAINKNTKALPDSREQTEYSTYDRNIMDDLGNSVYSDDEYLNYEENNNKVISIGENVR